VVIGTNRDQHLNRRKLRKIGQIDLGVHNGQIQQHQLAQTSWTKIKGFEESLSLPDGCNDDFLHQRNQVPTLEEMDWKIP
jgi:hypothetical protein